MALHLDRDRVAQMWFDHMPITRIVQEVGGSRSSVHRMIHQDGCKRNPDTKRCPGCDGLLPIDDFPKYGGSCKVCIKDKRLRKSYGLAMSDYRGMYLDQDGCCAICRKMVSLMQVDVDHDHSTLKVRGLLCKKCNKGLGLFDDNPDFLLQAVAYLTHNIEENSMAFKKYQSVEKSDVVSGEGHHAITDELRRTGKTRVSDMDEDEKRAVSTRLDSTDGYPTIKK